MKLLFQDFEGSVPELKGCQCETLLCIQVVNDQDKSINPAVFWLKIRDGKWHRFFIDSSYYFLSWTEHDEINRNELEDKEDFPVQDVGVKFGLCNRRIMEIVMRQVENVASKKGCLTIRFSDKLTLKVSCGDTGSTFSVF